MYMKDILKKHVKIRSLKRRQEKENKITYKLRKYPSEGTMACLEMTVIIPKNSINLMKMASNTRG